MGFMVRPMWPADPRVACVCLGGVISTAEDKTNPLKSKAFDRQDRWGALAPEKSAEKGTVGG